ncbi:enoyl-CoA hydratase/isomerase family protein [Sphingomonas oryzagri]
MRGKTVELVIEGGLARLTLNQPEKGNTFSNESSRDFHEAITEIANRRDVRAVLLGGKGRNFSFGGDIDSLSGNLDRMPEVVRELTADLHVAMARLARIDAPVIARVQGLAMGGAAAIVANCDFVICGHSARFGAAYAGIGLSCDLGASFGFASRMGIARARRFMLFGELVDAGEAKSIGLVDEVIDDALLDGRADSIAVRLSCGPTRAFGEVRRLMSRSLGQPFESQLEDEAQAIARAAASRDALEGISAFVDKRAPAFSGT